MDWEGYVGKEDARWRTWEAERKAAANHRFRHFKSKESQVLSAVVTSLLALFVR
jgi:hypothetical protein